MPLSLEEIGSFRNSTRLYIPYMLARNRGTVRDKEMDWEQDVLDQAPHFLSSFNDACFNPGIVHFNSLACSRTTGS